MQSRRPIIHILHARVIAALSPFAPASARAAVAQSRAEVVIQASAARVWQLLTHVEQWPRWNTAVRSVRLEGTFAQGARFVWRSGGFTVTSTLREVEAPRHLVWTGKALGTVAVHRWHLEETAGGIVVRTSETFDGWLPRLMPGAMQDMLDETLPRWLDALQKAAESGDDRALSGSPRRRTQRAR